MGNSVYLNLQDTKTIEVPNVNKARTFMQHCTPVVYSAKVEHGEMATAGRGFLSDYPYL